MVVRWLTVFVDRPAESFAAATDFWPRISGTERSPVRGETGEFATLLPARGDPHIRIQRIEEGPGGTHLDVHTDQVSQMVARAIELGAVEVGVDPVPVLRSPGGYTWCVVGHHGECERSAPFVGPSGAPSRLDQLCLDIAPAAFDAEVDFWAELLGSAANRSTARPEFASMSSPEMPLRLLFQRLDDGQGPTSAHIDIAAGDRIDDVVADHVAAGAEVVTREWPWTVMRDPSGHRYCVTPRDPIEGVISRG